MSTAEGYVLPKPDVPKTLGILNIIFGILLVVMGLFSLVVSVFLPMFLQGVESVAKEAQAKQEIQAKEQEKVEKKIYEDKLAAAKTDDEKKAIEQEKVSAPPRPVVPQVDLSFATDVFKDPRIMIVNNLGIVSGLILHIVLLISGIGLIRLAPWGRSMALWFAVLQIFQIILLTIGTIIYVVPANQANMEKMFAKMEAQAKTQGGPNPVGATNQMTKVMGAMAVPMAVAQAMTGMIYPVVLLIMLNTAGARAACLAKKPLENLDTF